MPRSNNSSHTMNNMFLTLFGVAAVCGLCSMMLFHVQYLPSDKHHVARHFHLEHSKSGSSSQQQRGNTQREALQGRVVDHEGVAEGRIEEEEEEGHSSITAEATEEQEEPETPPLHEPNHKASYYPHLDCTAYGGPSLSQQEMVYWQEIPSDKLFYRHRPKPTQYLTFEPDGGGWNNIRMAMETVFGLAIATNRILVLPPEQRMYLLGKSHQKQKNTFGFMDFFNISELSQHGALTMISMEEFLQREANTGHMRNAITNEVSFPPHNRTDWNGLKSDSIKELKEWLRNTTVTPHWSPQRCMAVFPATRTDVHDAEHLQRMHAEIVQSGFLKETTLDTPTPVDASPKDRLYEHLSGRKELCLYDVELQKAPIVHFMCYHKLRVRMLVHFYAFLYFENYKEDLWIKRYMRDHMRYRDEFQCAAARIVEKMRVLAESDHGQFDTLHVRRGDFQYKATRIHADKLLAAVNDTIKAGSFVYIATDERDKHFFDPLKKVYQVFFLDDFMNELEGTNHNYFGMIDQLVASRGRSFFGCWHSTFTGFIMRMRGYHSVKEKRPGYENGLLPDSFYYVPKENKNIMHKYAPLNGAFFNREFATSWRDLDHYSLSE